MRWIMGVVVGMGLCFTVSPVWAADDDTAEAAQAGAADMTFEQIRAAINTETDPELKAAMEEQLQLLESGELDLGDLEHTERGLALGAPPAPGESSLPAGSLGSPIDKPLPMPVVDGGGPGTAGTILDQLSPEAQAKMEVIFSEVETGRANGTLTEQQAHELAEQAGEIAARDLGVTREEMDKLFEQQDSGDWKHEGEEYPGSTPETYEAYKEWGPVFDGSEIGGSTEAGSSTHEGSVEHSTVESSYEAPTFESSYEAPTFESNYEAPTFESSSSYEAPEAPTYEAPEVSSYEAPSYEAPESPSSSGDSYSPPEQNQYEGGGYGGYEGHY